MIAQAPRLLDRSFVFVCFTDHDHYQITQTRDAKITRPTCASCHKTMTPVRHEEHDAFRKIAYGFGASDTANNARVSQAMGQAYALWRDAVNANTARSERTAELEDDRANAIADLIEARRLWDEVVYTYKDALDTLDTGDATQAAAAFDKFMYTAENTMRDTDPTVLARANLTEDLIGALASDLMAAYTRQITYVTTPKCADLNADPSDLNA